MRLRLAQRDPHRHRDVEVRLPAGATVADLLAALGAPDAPALVTSGALRLPPEQPLADAGLVDGDAVATDPDVTVVAAATALCPGAADTGALAVTGGPDAGRWLALPRGGAWLGRGPDAHLSIGDPTVSSLHAELRAAPDGSVHVRDLRSRNGTRVGGRAVAGTAVAAAGVPLCFGATRCRLEPHPGGPAGHGTHGRPAIGRPPGRPPSEDSAAPLPGPPRREAPPTVTTTLGIAGVGMPLLLGLVLGWLFSPMFALFALLGPTVAGSQWLDDRRRQRRARLDGERVFTERLCTFQDDLDRWRAHEVERSRATAPDPATLTGWLVSADRRCWSRTAADEDLLRVRLGTGPGDLAGAGDPTDDEPSPGEAEPEVTELLRRGRRVEDLPIAADLRSAGDLAVTGPVEVVRGILRAVVLQVAVLAPPSELAVAVVTDQPERWRDAAWLPHTRGDGSALVLPIDAAGRVTTADVGRVATAAGGCRVLLVVDADRPPRLVTNRGTAIHRVMRVASAGDASRGAGQVLEVSEASAATLWTADHRDGRRLLADGVGPEVFGAAARLLAGWDGGSAGGGGAEGVDLADLFAPEGLSAAAVVQRWEHHDHRLATPIGRDADGPVVLDLVTQGPHALLAGTTGAGKSELLRTLVIGLALSCPPERLTFLLFDFKGGSAFDACTGLPHSTEIVTDLDGHGATRALTCLQSEVRRRERALRSAGARDHGEHVRDGGDLPSLVIVVDEFAVLAEEHPGVLGALVDVARRGRSLGIHLVLATQRPSGVVTPEIRANTAVRICLRVEDPEEARDVVDDARPAAFARTAAGLALLRLGGTVVEFRAACAGLDAARPAVGPLLTGAGTDLPPPDPATLVRMCREAAATTGRRAAPSPLPPSLPDEVAPADLPAPDGGLLAVGLVDRPRRQLREPLLWELGRGPLVGIGLDAWRVPLAAGVAVAAGPRDTHLQVITCGTSLDGLADRPHTGSLVRPGEWDRLERLLRHLTEPGPEAPTILLVDDLPGLLRRLDDPRDLPLRTAVETLVLEGHEHRVHVAAGVPNGATVPAHLLGPGALLLAGAGVDRHDAAALGIGRVSGAGTDERLTSGPDGDEVVLVDGLTAAAPLAAETGATRPFRSPATPGEIPLDDVLRDGNLTGDPWLLPVGVGHADLVAATLPLRAGGGAVVAGPARSGRTSVLAVMAALVRTHRPDVSITVLAPGPGSVPGVGPDAHADTPSAAVERCRRPGEHLLLVDDAEGLADEAALDALLDRCTPRLRVVAAGRTDRLRTVHAGWLAELRRERCGVALSPDPIADGPIWDTVLPRRVGRGRGPTPAELLVDGVATRLLVARP